MLLYIDWDDIKNTLYIAPAWFYDGSGKMTTGWFETSFAEQAAARRGVSITANACNGEHCSGRNTYDSCPAMMGGYWRWVPFFINRQMLEYLGYDDEAELRILWFRCMHPWRQEPGGRFVMPDESRQNISWVGWIPDEDGSYIWVHDAGRQVVKDGRHAIISVLHDITDQNLRAKVLNLITTFRRGIPLPVWTFSVIGKTMVVRILGYTRDELQQWTRCPLWCPQDMAKAQQMAQRNMATPFKTGWSEGRDRQ